MALDTTVKYFHSGMSGAPVLSGTAGAGVGVLDAFLVTGFGLITLDSLVVSGGVATATRGAGQSFEKDAVILVAGATPAGLNGEKRILSVTGTTFTFDAEGISNQTATGTITAKMAPAGWEKKYSGTNLAAYRSLAVASNKTVLRVDDTNAQYMRVVGYESMTDVNTGTNPYPTAVQQSGGLYWGKSNAASSASRNWIAIADSRALLFFAGTYGSTPDAYTCYCFGELLQWKAADAYPGCIFGELSSNAGSSAPGSIAGNVFYPSASSVYLQRDAGGLATSQPGSYRMEGYATSNVASGQSGYPTYPSAIHGSIVAGTMIVNETVAINGDPRHTIPGALYLFTYMPNSSTFPSKTKVPAEGSLAGRILYSVQFGSGDLRGLVDISGPWR